ncbi:hypothetical protein ILUMI_25785 [Ignelater luminosus]|uniref:U2 snRNP-associated SURP motif-containing protein n=1 Tax=Ignelater luminosus TaxID=2038154 RepID=A0A8K0C6S7_IGNLU|nr:hypothetical protein ILUMI_25785 [Ignelater luminosus]
MSKKELERKQREEQKATAYAFQEFIKTFQDTSGPPNKMFVKSGILNVKTGQEIESEKGQIYNPQPFFKQDSSSTIKNAIECARLLKENKLDRGKGQEKPKSNLELLKEELKLRHMERGERNKIKDELTLYSSLGGLGSNDPNTTNLFIANINPKITEQDLMQVFGAYGPLASVKIMWPRCDDKTTNRTTNCGFVAFMSRSDGERAMHDLKDRDDMRVGWGKPVELPSNPIYIPPELLKLSLPPPYTGLPFNAQPLNQPFKYPTNEQEMEELLYNSVVKVTIPLDKRVLMTVHRMIEFVIREGPLFEAMIMNQEINNPTYQFLFDNRNSVHIYYRWKLYSLLHGDSQKNWSTKEFRMFKNGSIWCPPVIPNYTKGMPEHLINSSSKVDKSMLSDAQKTRFIQLIQTLNLTKKKIGETMVFCLNHVDAVKDIVDVIIDSFMNASTKAPKKIARLYLLSDVLYNSSMKKCYAPIYRTEFEKHLLEIFQQLHITFSSLNSTTDKETFKSKVLSVLRSWDLWKIYPNEYLNALENTFLGINSENEVEEDSDADEPLDGANLIKRSIKNGSEFVVKEEIKEKTKIVPLKLEQILPGFIPSKWETVDPEQVEAQAMSTKKFYDLEIQRQLQEEKKRKQTENKKLSEPEREMLRKVEVMVMQYQDEYESGKRKLKKGKSLENELDNYRNQLLEKMKKETHESRSKKSASPLSSDSNDERDKSENYSKHKKLRNKHSSYRDRENQKDHKRRHRF